MKKKNEEYKGNIKQKNALTNEGESWHHVEP